LKLIFYIPTAYRRHHISWSVYEGIWYKSALQEGSFAYLKGGSVLEQLFYQPTGSEKVRSSGQDQRENNIPNNSYVKQNPMILPADCNCSISLMEMHNH
jgi:hypothetical protein